MFTVNNDLENITAIRTHLQPNVYSEPQSDISVPTFRHCQKWGIGEAFGKIHNAPFSFKSQTCMIIKIICHPQICK